MKDPPPSPDDARDHQQLDALAAARSAGDGVAERDALQRLLGPYWEYARGIAYSRLASSPNRKQDAEDIASAVIDRLLRALAEKTDFGKDFWKVVRDNVLWEIADYYRARGRDESIPHDPAEMPYRRP